jgi:hypothetical protein
MNSLDRPRRRAAIDAALVCVAVLLIVQMWLLTATLESYLAGHHGVAGVAFAISAGLFAVCGAFYLMVVRLGGSRTSEVPPRSDAGPWQLGQR